MSEQSNEQPVDPRLTQGKPLDTKTEKATLAPNPEGDLHKKDVAEGKVPVPQAQAQTQTQESNPGLAEKIKGAVQEAGKVKITPENAGPYTVASLQTIIKQNEVMIQQLTCLNSYFKNMSES